MWIFELESMCSLPNRNAMGIRQGSWGTKALPLSLWRPRLKWLLVESYAHPHKTVALLLGLSLCTKSSNTQGSCLFHTSNDLGSDCRFLEEGKHLWSRDEMVPWCVEHRRKSGGVCQNKEVFELPLEGKHLEVFPGLVPVSHEIWCSIFLKGSLVIWF